MISNIKDDVTNVDNRNCRQNLNVISAEVDILEKNKVSLNNNLLLGDIPDYKLDNSNKLSGKFNNSVSANNSNDLISKNFYSNPGDNRGSPLKPRKESNNINVSGYNSHNLNTKNPFPGNNSTYKPKFVPASNNVNSYNNSPQYGSANNVGNLLIEGFQDTPHNVFGGNNIISPENNANNSNNANNANNTNSNVEPANNGDCQSLYPAHIEEYLKKAQSRTVPGENKKAVRSANNMMSAQGYKIDNKVFGYNESGAEANKYLCV